MAYFWLMILIFMMILLMVLSATLTFGWRGLTFIVIPALIATAVFTLLAWQVAQTWGL